MILYHFHTSPFARRVRIVMAMKGLEAELRDPRVDAKWLPELHRVSPIQTVPVLVDGDRVFTDSMAILGYLEGKVPSPSMWPTADRVGDALELVRLADRAIDMIVDLGLRFHALCNDPSWKAVQASQMTRVQGAIDRIGDTVAARRDAEALVGDRWSLADIAVLSLGNWLEGLPQRAPTFALAKQIVDLGWRVPAPLAEWTKAQKTRPHVAAIFV